MKRLEPNLLLALTTGLGLILLLMMTVIYGPPQAVIRNPLMAIICAGGFVLLNPRVQRAMKIPPRPPMVHADSPGTAVWSSVFPLLIILLAGVPVIWPGHDYGLLVIIASVWFAVTVESALKARGVILP